MDGQPPRGPLLWSFGLHAAVLTALLVSPRFQSEPIAFESFQVTLVSAPPAEAPEDTPPVLQQEELVVETPEPEPQVEEAPEEAAPILDEPEPDPEPEPEPPVEEPEPTPQPTEAEPAPTSSEAAEESESEAGADVNVRLEGLRRDYPAYYNSIILEIRKCFRPPAGNARAVVNFVIRRDGTVSDARLVERSGNASFDYAALGAIECAGNGRFGPLPDDLPYETLPVQFTFEPQRLGATPNPPSDHDPDPMHD